MLVINPFSPGPSTRGQIENISKGWWILLVSGLVNVVAGAIIVLTDWSIGDLAFAAGVVLLFRGFFALLSVPIDGSLRAWSIVLGLLEIGVGIAVWTWPAPTLAVIAGWIGWLLLLRGIMAVTGAVAGRGLVPAWGLVLAIGILEVVASFYLLARPGLTLVATILAIGLTAMSYGVVEVVAALEVKDLPRRLQTERMADGATTGRLATASA